MKITPMAKAACRPAPAWREAILSAPFLTAAMNPKAARLQHQLSIRFGDNGEAFVVHPYDNHTAQAIARYAQTSDWRLPIYNCVGYENREVMQYYNIPSRYDVSGNYCRESRRSCLLFRADPFFFTVIQRQPAHIRRQDILTVPRNAAVR